MREEKGRRRKEKENDREGRSRRRIKGTRYASGLKTSKPKMMATSLLIDSLQLTSLLFMICDLNRRRRRRLQFYYSCCRCYYSSIYCHCYW